MSKLLARANWLAIVRMSTCPTREEEFFPSNRRHTLFVYLSVSIFYFHSPNTEHQIWSEFVHIRKTKFSCTRNNNCFGEQYVGISVWDMVIPPDPPSYIPPVPAFATYVYRVGFFSHVDTTILWKSTDGQFFPFWFPILSYAFTCLHSLLILISLCCWVFFFLLLLLFRIKNMKCKLADDMGKKRTV